MNEDILKPWIKEGITREDWLAQECKLFWQSDVGLGYLKNMRRKKEHDNIPKESQQ